MTSMNTLREIDFSYTKTEKINELGISKNFKYCDTKKNEKGFIPKDTLDFRDTSGMRNTLEKLQITQKYFLNQLYRQFWKNVFFNRYNFTKLFLLGLMHNL